MTPPVTDPLATPVASEAGSVRRADGLRLHAGQPFPLGATWDGMGVNFSIYSQHAEGVELLLFDRAGDHAPAHVIPLRERTGPIFHGYLPDVRPGQLYGYHVLGPYAPERGHRFNPNKVLLDPYAKAIGRPLRWHDSLFGYEIGHKLEDLSFSTASSAPFAPLGAVIQEPFAWGDDRPPRIPLSDTIIYEAHVRGMTMLHPDVPPALRGTYLGMATEPVLDHLRALGVTSIQLLPVHAHVHDRRLHDMGLQNYWGYNTLSFFAPEPRYSTAGGTAAVAEFKTMVRTLHDAGFEVLLDVVYNHTGEGSQMGPTLSFRGIDNCSYYKHVAENPRFLMDYTGTGNTLDMGNAHVLQLVMDSLRYWVTEMHVDGFRFDLAVTLARELVDVNVLSAFFKVIQQDPVLSQVKLIAEPWDIGPGGYLVGSFPWQWAEWNGDYRDAVRRFWRGDKGLKGTFATRVAGSSDLYNHSGRRPTASINFITAHDGYTLQDFVSYEQKHNLANGEGNRDGHEPNYSVNFGVEGPTQDERTLEARFRMKRSLMSTLLLSQGVPMILGGDELSRTQRGNNNAYCQDNEINWFDWNLDGREERFLRFVQELVAFRRRHPNFRRHHFLRGTPDDNGITDATWWHPDGQPMKPEDWVNHDLPAFGLLLRGDALPRTDARGRPLRDASFMVLFNRAITPCDFVVPAADALHPPVWYVPRPFSRVLHANSVRANQTLRVPALAVAVLSTEKEKP